MGSRDPSIEWVAGDSRASWILGGVLTSLAVGVPLSLLTSWIIPWSWQFAHHLEYSVLTGLITGLSIFVGLMVWSLLVPMPAERLGISSRGITIDHGFRAVTWPWSRAILVGSRLYLMPSSMGLVVRLRVNQFQAARLVFLDRNVP